MTTIHNYEKHLLKELEATVCDEEFVNGKLSILTGYLTTMKPPAPTKDNFHENPNAEYLECVLGAIEDYLNAINGIMKITQMKMPPLAEVDPHNNKLMVLAQLRSDVGGNVEFFSKHIQYYFETLKERKESVDDVVKNHFSNASLLELRLFDKSVYDLVKQDIDKLAFSYLDLYQFIQKNGVDFAENVAKGRRGAAHTGMHN